MIDLALLRSNPEFFRKKYTERNMDLHILETVIKLDEEFRTGKMKIENLQGQANDISKNIGAYKRKGENVEPLLQKVAVLNKQIDQLTPQLKQTQTYLDDWVLYLPNPCLDTVIIGKTEKENIEIEKHGSIREFDFKCLPHWDLGPAYDIIDFEGGTKLSGSGFVVLKKLGSKFNRALINYFIDTAIRAGHEELTVPYLVKPEIMVGTGQLPKFKDQAYKCDDDLYLIPTAEVPVTNYHRDQILDGNILTKKYVCHTPCFRREAGAAGLGTRGMTRVHQFDKVEVVWFTKPENSNQELLNMLAYIHFLLQTLGLHYRMIQLCTGDTGFGSACTYDFEVWSPVTKTWLEVSSCSTFTDFQARRANIRYKEGKSKTKFVHTLNGSALAIPRCMIALLETRQQNDGSITIPHALQPYMGTDRILK